MHALRSRGRRGIGESFSAIAGIACTRQSPASTDEHRDPFLAKGPHCSENAAVLAVENHHRLHYQEKEILL
jgi:hypothetical protein